MNIKDLIKKQFSSHYHSQETLHAIIYREIVDTLKKEKNIDIGDYLESVTLTHAKVIIKTNSPLVSEEIQHVSGALKINIQEKLENLGKKLTNVDIITK